MVKKLLMLIVALLPFCNVAEGGVLEKFLLQKNGPVSSPMIRVLVVNDRPGVVVEVKGKYHLYDPNDNTHVSTRFIGKRKYIQALKGGLQWGEEFPGLHQIKIVPDDASVTTVVDGVEYKGLVYVYDVDGQINVVNEVPIEDYLASLLNPMVREPLSEETLAALAIVARTNAYYHIENPKSPYWDVDGQKIGYHGYAVVDRKTPINKAINGSRSLIMSRSGSGKEEKAVPFLAQWDFIRPIDSPVVDSNISIIDAEKMANKGDNAAQILTKAYPGTALKSMHNSTRP